MDEFNNFKIAYAHHWLLTKRGGESVLCYLIDTFGNSDIYTLFYKKGKVSPTVDNCKVYSSFLNKLPFVENYYRNLLPLFPFATLNLKIKKDHYNFLISSDSSLIKGINKPENLPHFCYCHSPPRYLWDMLDVYLQNSQDIGKIKSYFLKVFVNYLRDIDLKFSKNVDYFIANSEFVSARIKKFYNRESSVIYPPVDLDFISPYIKNRRKNDYYLCVSQLVAYKRIDLAIKATNKLNRPLIIVGNGPELKKLKKISGANVTFLNNLPRNNLFQLISNSRALIAPQIEDFGILTVEAQAAGVPVIGLDFGGTSEIVKHDLTGVLMKNQTEEDLISSIQYFEKNEHSFESKNCTLNAQRFSVTHFRSSLINEIETKLRISLNYLKNKIPV